MYIPKSKYNVIHTSKAVGEEFFLQDGKKYTGYFIKTYTGEYLTGKTIDENSKTLTRFYLDDEYTSEAVERHYIFANDVIIPTKEDYENTYFTRFFLEHKVSKVIIEANREKYNYYAGEKYINSISLTWRLFGPKKDENKGIYIQFGAESDNLKSIKEAAKTIKSLPSFVKDYGQFVR